MLISVRSRAFYEGFWQTLSRVAIYWQQSSGGPRKFFIALGIFSLGRV
jgi:hypothetical protein